VKAPYYLKTLRKSISKHKFHNLEALQIGGKWSEISNFLREDLDAMKARNDSF
jgi:hypothetical protein